MSEPHKCPVCNGEGKVYDPDATSTGLTKTCHACSGTGIVWEPKPTYQGVRI